MIRKRIHDMRKGKQLKYMKGFRFNFSNMEQPKVKDLSIYLSQTNEFPDQISNEDHYLNKSKFMFHTDIRRRDRPLKPGDQDQLHHKQEISKYTSNKFDPLDMKNRDKQPTSTMKKKTQNLDYVFITLKSLKGCKIKIKLRIIGEYTGEFIAAQNKLKQDQFIDDYQTNEYKKGIKMKHYCKREHTQYLLRHKLKSKEEFNEAVNDAVSSLHDYFKSELVDKNRDKTNYIVQNKLLANIDKGEEALLR